MRLACQLTVLTALLAAAAAPADAAVVSVKSTRVISSSDLSYKAGRGEANRVRFEVTAKRVTVTDRGARIRARRGCKPVGTHRAVCRAIRGGFFYYVVTLGDRGDRATFVPRARGQMAIAAVKAGAGDDVIQAGRLKRYGILAGGRGDDRITGTKDADAISGGAGSDLLIGLNGDDQFESDPSGATADDDEVRGGPGADSVSYSGRTRPIAVDLRRRAPQGSAGERDVFRSVDAVVGTGRDDTLLGNGRDNDLQGIGGSDVIEGFGGDDRVWSAGGAKDDATPDTLSGGTGGDIVLSEGGGTATGGPGDDEFEGSGTLDGGDGDDTFDHLPTGGRVECGAGSDSVWIDSVAPPLLVACESVDLGRDKELTVGLPLQRGENDIVAPSLSCFEEDEPTADRNLCTNELSVTLGDRLLASGTFDANNQNVGLRMPYREGAKEALGADPKQVRATVGRYAFDSFL